MAGLNYNALAGPLLRFALICGLAAARNAPVLAAEPAGAPGDAAPALEEVLVTGATAMAVCLPAIRESWTST